MPQITPVSSSWIWGHQEWENNYKSELKKIIEDHGKTIETKLLKIKNYDKWIFFLRNFESLKKIEKDDLLRKHSFIEDPRRSIDEIKGETYKNIMENEKNISLLDKFLPIITEIDKKKKYDYFLDFLLSFPNSEEWEKDAIFCFAKKFKFDYLWYLLPQDHVIYEILNSLRNLEKWKWNENRIVIEGVKKTL